MDELVLREKLGRAIGEASMLWSETPKGVFESTRGAQLLEDLVESIRTMNGFRDGVRFAVEEVQGWRALTIKAHNECRYVDPKEALREVKNKLNLLGVIESKLRCASGEVPTAVFHSMIAREKTEELKP